MGWRPLPSGRSARKPLHLFFHRATVSFRTFLFSIKTAYQQKYTIEVVSRINALVVDFPFR